MRILTALFLVFASSAIQGGEVIDANISHNGNRYFIHIVMQMEADPNAAYDALTDYANLARLDQAIVESTLTHAEHPNYQVRVVTDGCAIMFCKKMVQLQNVQEMPNGYVLVDVVPEGSDFEYGRILWRIYPHADGTRVNFDAELVPGFWVPPILGPMILKSGFLKETRHMIDGIERIAGDPDNSATAEIHPTTPDVVPSTRTP